STIDLALDVARSQSAENPVYYIQYAHARIASVRRKAGEDRVARALSAIGLDVELHPSERALVKKLLAFPEETAEAAERRTPHRIAAYALALAHVFTAFSRSRAGNGSSTRWPARASPTTATASAPSARCCPPSDGRRAQHGAARGRGSGRSERGECAFRRARRPRSRRTVASGRSMRGP